MRITTIAGLISAVLLSGCGMFSPMREESPVHGPKAARITEYLTRAPAFAFSGSGLAAPAAGLGRWPVGRSG